MILCNFRQFCRLEIHSISAIITGDDKVLNQAYISLLYFIISLLKCIIVDNLFKIWQCELIYKAIYEVKQLVDYK